MEYAPTLFARVLLAACAVLIVVTAYASGLLTDLDERDPARGTHLPHHMERRAYEQR